MTYQKLELTWIGKDQRSQLEPRILLEDLKCSYHAKQRMMGATMGMYGGLQEIEGLEFPAFADDRAS